MTTNELMVIAERLQPIGEDALRQIQTRGLVGVWAGGILLVLATAVAFMALVSDQEECAVGFLLLALLAGLIFCLGLSEYLAPLPSLLGK